MAGQASHDRGSPRISLDTAAHTHPLLQSAFSSIHSTGFQSTSMFLRDFPPWLFLFRQMPAVKGVFDTTDSRMQRHEKTWRTQQVRRAEPRKHTTQPSQTPQAPLKYNKSFLAIAGKSQLCNLHLTRLPACHGTRKVRTLPCESEPWRKQI
jgi:hypothetical protein